MLALGIALLIFAFYQKHRVSAARGDVDSFSRFFSKNPISDWGESSLHKKLDKYDTQITWLFIGSGFLIISGSALCFYFRNKKS